MNFSTIVRAALHRWYITVPGVLLSLLIATTVLSSMPPKYTSSGIAVLVRQNNPTMTNFVNPILGTDGSLSTVTLTLVQALDTPEVKAQLGLREGADDFKISNVGQATTAVTIDHPFIYITTQSSDAQKSAEIVGGVIDVARQKLAELQTDFHVRPQNQIKLESIVDATPPKMIMYTVFAVAGAALMLGIVATFIVAYAWDKIIAVRQRQRTYESAPHAKKNTNCRARKNSDPRVRASQNKIL